MVSVWWYRLYGAYLRWRARRLQKEVERAIEKARSKQEALRALEEKMGKFISELEFEMEKEAS